MKLKTLFLDLWYWQRNNRLKSIQNKLTKSVRSKKISQQDLKLKIMKEVRSYLGIDKDDMSKFIPYDNKTRIRTREHIEALYGDDMRRLNVKLTKQLRLL